MLQLHPDKVQLWFAFCDEIADQSLLADYRRLLVDEERQKDYMEIGRASCRERV